MIYPHSQTGCKMAETFTYKHQQDACFDNQAARRENIDFGPLSEMRSSPAKSNIVTANGFFDVDLWLWPFKSL